MRPELIESRAENRAPLLLGLSGLGGLAAAGGMLAFLGARLQKIHEFPAESLRRVRDGATTPLFERHPELAARIPWKPLGAFPTPVHPIADPSGIPGAAIWVKRDDLTSSLYGGNKVRKLEHFLAEASLAERRTLITLGGIGSNHALATAVHGAAHGYTVDLALYDQPVTPFVRRNLGGFVATEARLEHARGVAGALFLAGRMRARRARAGGSPYFIMVGGTSRLGCIGYVNAGLELARQVAEGVLPEPDRIFLPLGTCGTAAGLLVGLKLGGLRTRISAVRVADPFPASPFTVRVLAQDVADFLHAAGRSVPRLRIKPSDFDVVTNALGPGYGYPTAGGEEAVRSFAPELSLETTYSGKTMAACLEYCRRANPGETVLFWNTFSSAPIAEPVEWRALPASLRPIVND